MPCAAAGEVESCLVVVVEELVADGAWLLLDG